MEPHVFTGWPAVQISLLQNVWQTMKGVFTKRTTTREIAAPVFYKEKKMTKNLYCIAAANTFVRYQVVKR